MKKYLTNPIVIIPLIVGVVVSFVLFLKIWEEKKIATAIYKNTSEVNILLPDGDLLNIEDGRNYYEKIKGEKVLLVFLTTKCRACKKEVQTISSDLAAIDSRIKVFGVFIQDQELVSDFVSEEKLRFPVLIDKGANIFRELKIKYFPTKMIVEKGTITKIITGSAPDFERLVKDLNLGD